ncbi:MAG: RNA-binding protein [Epulopiscium sp.]|nr:RNA-binding protein [Candidatus Epulonipiscium sp.]
MNEYTIGQIVFSKSGRDKGKPFIVVKVEGEYLYLVDGDLRKLHKPKKKKNIHLQKTKEIVGFIKSGLEEGKDLKDSDIRKALNLYKPFSINVIK